MSVLLVEIFGVSASKYLEISFFFPWCVLYNSIAPFGFWTMFGFFFILTLGLVYEWLKGGLE